MRLVLDTNIVTSGLLWRGTSYQLLTHIKETRSLQLALYGGEGNDQLHGDQSDFENTPPEYAGQDYLDGELGNDTLRGGAGNDTYMFDELSGVDVTLGSEGKNQWRTQRQLATHLANNYSVACAA